MVSEQEVGLCAVAALLIVGIFVLMCVMRDESRFAMSSEAGPPSEAVPAVRRFDKDLVNAVFPTTASDAGQGDCAVCLSHIDEAQAIRQLQCKHNFHEECIDGWWIHGPLGSWQCPLCRHPQSLVLDV